MAASIITNKPVKLHNLDPNSIQGDKKIIDIFTKMGTSFEWDNSTLICYPANEIKPVQLDLTDTPDLAPILAVVCSFANGTSVLTGTEHLKFKESDRVKTIVENLRKCSINIDSDNKVCAAVSR